MPKPRRPGFPETGLPLACPKRFRITIVSLPYENPPYTLKSHGHSSMLWCVSFPAGGREGSDPGLHCTCPSTSSYLECVVTASRISIQCTETGSGIDVARVGTANASTRVPNLLFAKVRSHLKAPHPAVADCATFHAQVLDKWSRRSVAR